MNCGFSANPNSRKQIDKGIFTAFLKILSNDFQAVEQPTHKVGYERCMSISRGPHPLFQVHYTRDLESIRIQRHPNANLYALMDPESTRLWTGGGGFFEMRCDFSIKGPAKRGEYHPHSVLERRMREPGSLIPGVVSVLLNEQLARSFAAIQADAGKRRDFSRLLAAATRGSVKTLLSNIQTSPKMEAVDSAFLYGLTCVYPWAIDLLMLHPKCLMTDTTFKAVKPYTLAILHVIFANESIPIGFAIWPSEAHVSYGMLYRHILDLLACTAWVKQNQSPRAVAALLSLSPEEALWKIEDDDGLSDDEDLDGPPDSACTFSIGPDGDCEEETWDEESPAERSVAASSEHGEAYYRMRGITHPVIWAHYDLLLGVPIVTDQGKALEKFVQDYGLIWKLCHRHILENIGAKCRNGRWAARLLRCFSARQYRRTRFVIKKEIKALKLNYYTKGAVLDRSTKALLRLLGDLQDTKPLSDIRRWALWLRLGCPRTTNSAESVNGHLNAEILERESFVERVLSVAHHFAVRYASRNKWRDTALGRNKSKCYHTEEQMRDPSYSAAKELFYQHLHDTVGRTFAERHGEKFPEERRALFFSAQAVIFFLDLPPPLPKNWVDGAIRRTRPAGPVDGDDDPSVLRLHEKSAHTVLSHMAWQIACDLKMDIGPDEWKRHGQEIYTGIVKTAALLDIRPHRVSATREAAWRSLCWEWLPTWTVDTQTKSVQRTKTTKRVQRTKTTTTRQSSAKVRQGSKPTPRKPPAKPKTPSGVSQAAARGSKTPSTGSPPVSGASQAAAAALPAVLSASQAAAAALPAVSSASQAAARGSKTPSAGSRAVSRASQAASAGSPAVSDPPSRPGRTSQGSTGTLKRPLPVSPRKPSDKSLELDRLLALSSLPLGPPYEPLTENAPLTLANFGNTCYLNASLQCLLRLESLASWVAGDLSYMTRPNLRGKHNGMAEIWIRWYKFLNSDTDVIRTPRDVWTVLSDFHAPFAAKVQHDMAEAVAWLVDALHDDLDGCRAGAVPAIAASDTDSGQLEPISFPDCTTAWNSHTAMHENIVIDLFAGQRWTGYECPVCRASRGGWQPFTTLPVPLTDPHAPDTEPSGPLQLGECIDSIGDMTEHEMLQCDKCKLFTDARKCERIVRLPQILILHLVRFSHDMGGKSRKLHTHVEFDQELDMSQHGCSPDLGTHYRLKAVGVHRGRSLDAGHYFAYVSLAGRWHCFDDNTVSKVDWEEVSRQQAYMLFYEKV
jgi:ubiquitin C-terminal hydrolase